MSKHPRDDEKPRPHTPPVHQHVWVPIRNEWDEITGYRCGCGAYQSA